MKLDFKHANLEDLNKVREESLTKLHQKRLESQRQGTSEYFIAYEQGEPVGHVWINYKPPEPFQGSVVLEDLFVKESKRRQGIGRKMVEFVEKHVLEKGFTEICLDVEVGEQSLIEMYEKLGYKRVSGPHETQWSNEDQDTVENLTVFHMVKQL